MSATSSAEPEQFIFTEARLLDERRFDEWLALLDDDVIYCVPNSADDSPIGSGVIVREDLPGLRARVARIVHPENPTQKPPARTLRVLTNVTVSEDGGGAVDVRANLVLYVSKGQRLVQHPGRIEYQLHKVDGSWRIRRKNVYLIANDQALTQLPLI
ncbi:MAG TPA: aromatic-ring-hydroxylating dioxygenase subunit beta [Candidatus Binatia bacterium]|nr:aromatic-ring-hydroxylating dioxygenase subunit beta [Candidatus Binatia bacterium]